MIEIITEEIADVLLYLHPMIVTPHTVESNSIIKYKLVSGLQTYLLARSLVDTRQVPVLVVKKAPVPDEPATLFWTPNLNELVRNRRGVQQ